MINKFEKYRSDTEFLQTSFFPLTELVLVECFAQKLSIIVNMFYIRKYLEENVILSKINIKESGWKETKKREQKHDKEKF